MIRFLVLLASLLFAAPALAAGTAAPKDLKDLYYGEALYYAYQGDWFEAIARLDTELAQYRGLDEPALDSLYYHIDQAEFDVGDFELFYRMHQRAGRAIKAVIEGNVEETVRNEAIFRLARIYFQKDQPQNALQAVERIKGAVPGEIRDDLAFLRAQILMANGRFDDAARILKDLQGREEPGRFHHVQPRDRAAQEREGAGRAPVSRPHRPDRERQSGHAGDQGQIEPRPRRQADE